MFEKDDLEFITNEYNIYNLYDNDIQNKLK